jgi:hypothetical protein
VCALCFFSEPLAFPTLLIFAIKCSQVPAKLLPEVPRGGAAAAAGGQQGQGEGAAGTAAGAGTGAGEGSEMGAESTAAAAAAAGEEEGEVPLVPRVRWARRQERRRRHLKQVFLKGHNVVLVARVPDPLPV